MYFEELQSDSKEELDGMIDEFTAGRIIYSVDWQKIGRKWTANIFYDDIVEEEK